MRALIDGDIVCYRVAWTTEQEEEGIAIWRTSELVQRILSSVGASHYSLFLSGPTVDGFRYALYPAYKQNRKQPKPKHYDLLRAFLIEGWDSHLTSDQEADDALGIEHSKDPYNSILCSIDKDFKQLPGHHYNFVKEEIFTISEEEAIKNFYLQILIGDVVDNIPGLWRIGPVRAANILHRCTTEDELFEKTLEAYKKQNKSELDLLLVGTLLKIRTTPEELWTFPKTFQHLLPDQESLLSFSQTKAAEVLERIRSSESSTTEKETGPQWHGQQTGTNSTE